MSKTILSAPLLLLVIAAIIVTSPGVAAAQAAEQADGAIERGHDRDIESWRVAIPPQPSAVLVRGATVWTMADAGILEQADLLVRDGKIARVGTSLRAPSGAMVIEADGLHVTPGLIDAHSHTAITGGLNEGTNLITAEVGIEDVLEPRDINIYRQLAGGLTSANVLHGSANPIGGRNAIIKLRWGQGPDGLLFEGAKSGIKFALGENPKQVNFGSSSRYPKTRAGVEEAIRERFLAARDYRRDQQLAADSESRIAPEPDLQLEAIAEILDGTRLVHAHSYRADEILMILRLCEEFGVTIATLQHVLEGYKVADEIAAHGAGASTFADWWSYKYEVIDAIPHNGAIMHDRGVVVSFNSDDDDLARRLNLDAAKAVQYGGLSPVEALGLVTINPARQLQIDERVGSLEEGKDADLVLWSGDPLSTQSIVLQSWIDGRRYFDREQDLAMRTRLEAEKQAIAAQLLADEQESEEEDQEQDQEEQDVRTEADDEPGTASFVDWLRTLQASGGGS